MLENWKSLATWSYQPIQVQKVGTSTFVADYSKGTTQYTQVTGTTKKKVTFQEIVNYASQLGDTAVKIISALKSPQSAGTGLSLSGLSADEAATVAAMQAEAEATTKRRQRNILIGIGAALLVAVALVLIYKSKK
ncbi:hypothetical protein ACAW74_18190 [Fibrella sp. WM1]|uniref:hypothetical protein n=1 Tax=Fibrella musci TaxID=3242485 RepID=UPI00352107AE